MKKTFIHLLTILLIHLFSAKLIAQNVGIGTITPNPAAKLHVDLGTSLTSGLLINGVFNASGSVPNLGPGSRMMYYPAKGSFRAGTVQGLEWNNVNVGRHSVAFGLGTQASNIFSFAAGDSSLASGNSSLSIGKKTQATGLGSVAFGEEAWAFGDAATATGSFTSAPGRASTATGDHTNAAGIYSTSMGLYTSARSAGSVTMGRYNELFSASSTFAWVNTDPLLILGNGSGLGSRHNALVVYKNGNTVITGFTSLGEGDKESAPAIKMKAFTANTATTQGAWTDVEHGLSASKILSVSILTDASPAFAVQIPPSYRFSAGYEYYYHISATNIVVINSPGNSGNILNKPIKILVTYKE